MTLQETLQRAYARNRAFAKPGSYTTHLGPVEELLFRSWVLANHVPFNPQAKVADYDMRGFYHSSGGVPHRVGTHYPDTFKTPYHASFSRESRYATPNNPFVWHGETLIDRRNGRVIYGPGH